MVAKKYIAGDTLDDAVRVTKEIEKSKRYDLPMTLIFLDLDNFKRINDTKGHEVGNMILIKVSEIIKKNIRIRRNFGGN